MFEDCPVEMLQVKSEFAWLFDIYVKSKPKHVLEIGSFYGGSLYHWIKGADSRAKIVSVDFLVSRRDERYSKLMEARERWGDWVKGTDKTFVSIVGSSQDVDTVARVHFHLPEVDFLYIDANHSEEACWSDVRNYWPLVRSGGIMAMHDIGNHEYGAWKVWDALKKDYPRHEERLDVPEYCGTGVMWKP